MLLRILRAHYDRLIVYERDRIIGLKEAVEQTREFFSIRVEVIWRLEDAGKNVWTIADFSGIMVVVQKISQQITRTE